MNKNSRKLNEQFFKMFLKPSQTFPKPNLYSKFTLTPHISPKLNPSKTMLTLQQGMARRTAHIRARLQERLVSPSGMDEGDFLKCGLTHPSYF